MDVLPAIQAVEQLLLHPRSALLLPIPIMSLWIPFPAMQREHNVQQWYPTFKNDCVALSLNSKNAYN